MSEIQANEGSQTILPVGVEAGKFLTFKLDVEEYGLEITKVQEIIGVLPAIKIPGAPEHVRGVVNLRGRIIPTIELRSKFKLPDREDTERTCIIVVEAMTAKGKINVGVLVDEVAEVLDIAEENINVTPEFGREVNTDFIIGIGVVDDKIMLLLDIDRVIGTDTFDYKAASSAH